MSIQLSIHHPSDLLRCVTWPSLGIVGGMAKGEAWQQASRIRMWVGEGAKSLFLTASHGRGVLRSVSGNKLCAL